MVYIKEIKRSSPLKEGDVIEFYLNDEVTIKGHIAENLNTKRVYINLGIGNNSLIFEELGIVDKNKFVSEVVGYTVNSGTHEKSWPEVNSFKELEMVLDALMKVNKAPSVNSDNINIKVKTNKSVKLNYKL